MHRLLETASEAPTSEKEEQPASDMSVTLARSSVTNDERLWPDVSHVLVRAVTVVTATAGAYERGATVSSVSCVSIKPLILALSLRSTSKLLAAIVHTSAFGINVLKEGQRDVALRFARSNRHETGDEFAGWSWVRGAFSGARLLCGALARIECELLDTYRIENHELVLAKVHSADIGTGAALVTFGRDLASVVGHGYFEPPRVS